MTFCGAHGMVTGTGAGAGIAMSIALGVAYQRYCVPKPSGPPTGCLGARFWTADIVFADMAFGMASSPSRGTVADLKTAPVRRLPLPSFVRVVLQFCCQRRGL